MVPARAGGAGRRLAVGGVACYEPKPCDNQCEVQVAIDGAPVAHAAHTNLVGQPIDQSDVRPDGMAHNQVKRDYGGEVKVTVAEHEKAERHTYTLTMPWGVGAARRNSAQFFGRQFFGAIRSDAHTLTPPLQASTSSGSTSRARPA